MVHVQVHHASMEEHAMMSQCTNMAVFVPLISMAMAVKCWKLLILEASTLL